MSEKMGAETAKDGDPVRVSLPVLHGIPNGPDATDG